MRTAPQISNTWQCDTPQPQQMGKRGWTSLAHNRASGARAAGGDDEAEAANTLIGGAPALAADNAPAAAGGRTSTRAEAHWSTERYGKAESFMELDILPRPCYT